MFRKSKPLADSFYATNRQYKREMLVVGICRPNRRLMNYCIWAGGICAALCLVTIILRYERASLVLLFIMGGIGLTMVAIQQSSNLAEHVKRHKTIRSDDGIPPQDACGEVTTD